MFEYISRWGCFPPEIYEEFQDHLVPVLMDVLKSAIEETRFSASHNQAITLTINKKEENAL